MAIVSEIPFTLQFVKEYPQPVSINCSLFWDNISEAYASDIPTAAIEENDPISILFKGKDDSRLYLDALDIIPDRFGCNVDDDGKIYHSITDEPLPLYRVDSNEFDELRVDNFIIEVLSDGKWYYGWLQIKPKQLSGTEW